MTNRERMLNDIIDLRCQLKAALKMQGAGYDHDDREWIRHESDLVLRRTKRWTRVKA